MCFSFRLNCWAPFVAPLSIWPSNECGHLTCCSSFILVHSFGPQNLKSIWRWRWNIMIDDIHQISATTFSNILGASFEHKSTVYFVNIKREVCFMIVMLLCLLYFLSWMLSSTIDESKIFWVCVDNVFVCVCVERTLFFSFHSFRWNENAHITMYNLLVDRALFCSQF